MKNLKRFKCFVFIFLSLFILTSCSSGTIPPPQTPSPPSIQKINISAGFDKEYFEEICFSTKFGSANHPTYRWAEAIKICLINPPTEEKRKICENKVYDTKEAIDYAVSVDIVYDIKDANITVE